MNLMEDLKYRGLVYQATDEPGLDRALAAGPLSLYAGFDPTADSLGLWHLLSILLLRRFQLAGHRPIAVVGGGTGLIGDPSGKSAERSLNPRDVVEEWTRRIRSQLERFLDFSGESAARVVNNHDWLGPWKVVDFLRDTGKHFPLAQMLHKESVTARMEAGISFTEFSYMILQAYDFQQLFERHGCRLQVGGSDQWGNITAGCELIRRTQALAGGEGAEVFGLTTPMVTRSDGKKFGKTEAGAVWLDPAKTSPYQFYQFCVNTPDEDAGRFLRYFTFLSRREIEALEEQVRREPGKREAQARLARELTVLAHGERAYQSALRISQALFYGEVSELSESEMEEGFRDVPSFSLQAGQSPALADLLVMAGACPSKRQAREDVQGGAVSVNGRKAQDPAAALSASDRLHGKYTVLRRGKKHYTLVKWA